MDSSKLPPNFNMEHTHSLTHINRDNTTPEQDLPPRESETALNEKVRGTTKLVDNAALSHATATQKPSLLTKRMFLVRKYAIKYHT
jgi:hypothetical protein